MPRRKTLVVFSVALLSSLECIAVVNDSFKSVQVVHPFA